MQLNSEVGSDNALAAAAGWIEGVLTGSLATAVAIIAIGGLGLMLMSGRLPRRRAAELILGGFIIFGAPAIAAGVMRALASSSAPASIASTAPVARAPLPSPGQPAVQMRPYDPYAGAAMPPPR